ncbi:MAG: Protein translocase subunit SecE, partial [uncultured Nocardioidaceae bacterium]
EHQLHARESHQPGDLLPPGGGRAPEGRLADPDAADHLLLGGPGLRGRRDDVRRAARPRLRQGRLRDLRL